MKDLKTQLIEKMQKNSDTEKAYQDTIEHIYMQMSRDGKASIDEIFELLTGETLKEMIEEARKEVTIKETVVSNGLVPMSFVP